MPTKNDVFFYSWQLRKRHHMWWASQANFGPSYFVKALGILDPENKIFFSYFLIIYFVRAGPIFVRLAVLSQKTLLLCKNLPDFVVYPKLKLHYQPHATVYFDQTFRP